MNQRSPAPPSSAVLEAGAAGAKVAVTRWGRGPAVLCLHAIGHGARDFSKLAERLDHRFEFVAIDWPGHGASPSSDSPVTATRFAEILAAVLDELCLRRVVIIGSSIGGAAAILYAAQQPDRVSALVLCNPGGLQPVGPIARLVCRRMAAFFARGERREPGYLQRFRRYYEREVLSSPSAAWRREEIIANADRTAGLLRQAWEGFASTEADLRALAPGLGCPVLFAWAKRDRYIAWSRSKRAAISVPRHIIRFFDGSHCAFLEEPDRFDQEFLTFIDGVTEAAGAAEFSKAKEEAL
jgi:4,5:9,10-diseco-3-hydroxy-5,9,17-trioxoandrosta-1(10),2-diene-4-oate hydrolase